MLWSFGSTDPIHGHLDGHGQNRGAKPLHLMNPIFRKQGNINKNDVLSWDIAVKNVTIEPSMDTLYWCKIVSSPILTSKHHIIGYEPLLTRAG